MTKLVTDERLRVVKHRVWIAATFLLCASSFAAQGAPARWVEGKNYVRLDPQQPTTVPAGKIEVMEVFSYGCPFCYRFQPVIARLERELPRNAVMVFLPASFLPDEDWPMFQRAYFAAQSLGVAQRAHQAIYDAVWKTGELAIVEPNSNRLKNPLPSLKDAARCYGRITGVKPQAFLAAARSFGVEAKVLAADSQVEGMRIPSTPCLVVNGKYRIVTESLSSADEVVGLVKFLIAKENTR